MRSRIALWFAVGFCSLLAAAFGQKQPASHQAAPVTWRAPANTNPEAYVGAEACAGCHEEQARQFGKTVHATAEPSDVKYGAGCESCHGPGKAHVDAISAGNIDEGRKLIFTFRGKPAENAARCLRCHSSSPDQRLFERSEHKLMGISCEQCHASHLVVPAARNSRPVAQFAQSKFFQAPKLPEERRWLTQSLLKTREPDLCFSCHKSIQAQFSLPTHHRVPEGLMKCTDCHDAHGTLNRANVRKVNFESCVTCHAEKRGPFVYEHAPVKIEGCTSCHSPHGTIERNMLLRREGRFLCLQCHVDPQAPNVPHGRLGFTTRGECIRCHATVHGSNVSRFFLQ